MKDENYILIQGWMINNLNLKSNELMAYAVIYGFSQDGNSEFTGSLKYLENTLSLSRNTVIQVLKNLIDKDLITKTEFAVNNVKFNKYKINTEAIKRNCMGSAEIALGVVQKLDGGSAEIAPNNTIYNTNINNHLLSEIKISDDRGCFLIKDKTIAASEEEIKYFTIANQFRTLFIKNLKERKAPTTHQEKATFKNYVNPIRLMIENKEATEDQLREAYRYLNSTEGEFWKTNILSTDKLRKQITAIIAKKNMPVKQFKPAQHAIRN